MARCRSCFKSGLFTRVNENGFCPKCEIIYNENMISYLSKYQNRIVERKTNYYFTLAGIKQNNPDTGINRQKIIKNSKVGEKLMVVLDPDISYGHEALKIVRFDGRQIGYLEPSESSDAIKNLLRNNEFIDASISSIFGKKGNYSIEVNLTTYKDN